MTLSELKYITALAQQRHFGRAAEQCNVSQPTLSVAIKKLESELGVGLFERSKVSVNVTPLGEKIVRQAQVVLEGARSLKELAAGGKNQLKGPLKIGAIFTIGPYLYPHLIPQVQQLAPEMPLYIEEDYTRNLRKKLRDGELDIIVIALPFTEADVLCKPLYDETFEVLLPQAHPWLKHKTIDPNLLPNSDLMLLGDGHCFRDQVLAMCPALAKHTNSRLGAVTQGSSLETLRHMVASGLGITVLPKSATGTGQYAQGLLHTRPFKQPMPSRTVAIAWRASFPRPQVIDLISEAVKKCQLF
jgi:LysR family hydrogen peroxide-inducible transcriptional activator